MLTLDYLLDERKLVQLFGPTAKVGSKKIFLAEKPKVTIQGTGPYSGNLSLLIRFFGNNLNNLKHSDISFYTKKDLSLPELPRKNNRVTFNDYEILYKKIFEYDGPLEYNNIIFSGGESLLWQLDISNIIRIIYTKNRLSHKILEIETNGSVLIDTDISDWMRTVHYNIRVNPVYQKSIPLVSQFLGDIKEKNITHINHDRWCVIFKYSKNKYKRIEKLIQNHKIPKHKIYLECEKNDIIECVEKCIKCGYNYSPSLHKNI